LQDEIHRTLDKLCRQRPDVNRPTIGAVMSLALEIAREGREGRRIGTLFVVGDCQATLRHSKSLILDPLWYHPSQVKHITDFNLRETVKELAQMDGAFLVDADGTVVSACCYVNASAEGIVLPLGLGSRHMAAAAITQTTQAVAIVVSESGRVRLFSQGKIVAVFKSVGEWRLEIV
jgi:DNA integrity scanning protein DisA with diadenylate cyclase activity